MDVSTESNRVMQGETETRKVRKHYLGYFVNLVVQVDWKSILH